MTKSLLQTTVSISNVLETTDFLIKGDLVWLANVMIYKILPGLISDYLLVSFQLTVNLAHFIPIESNKALEKIKHR